MVIFGLFGKTGCGKTEILQRLKKKHPVIDIEGIARTRGSILGDLYHLNMATQEEFDREIYEKIREAQEAGYLIVEYEGRKIGGIKKLEIPSLLADFKNYNYRILIDCPYKQQIETLVSWYKPEREEEKKLLIERILTLRRSFKNLEMIKKIDRILEKIRGDRYYEAAELIERELYRSHYLRNIKKIVPDLVVYNRDIEESVKKIEAFIEEKLRYHGISWRRRSWQD
ncbi:MAG TPA: selenouridine synthase SelU-like subunit [Methanothermococcus okinawensis]|uniref:Selenouridine synthase SelU-like subunit n=1 Tax=Methanothermococcus okinawensis TaxID=155863 RepID=A0A832ZIQ5_9EURY|nr:selenouridine synthase SelU-like subunit [Methanothermococcus okinawensis]HIP90958.1 selenouridine synthase SelU-like subunit [Methanothermococcus okinawensis]